MDQKLTCSQCGLEFPASEIITYENNYVCGGCKPIFVQKLREGMNLSTTTHYAGFWIRVGAKIIDIIILWVVGIGIGLIVYQIFPKPHYLPAAKHLDLGIGYFLSLGINWLLAILYEVLFLGKFGATLGKMICRIQVIMADGQKISYGRAFGRYWAESLSGLIFGIGYFMVGSDKEKRGLHDRICNTRVVYK